MRTFLWHDYETFGATPRKDKPAQFAAIRTDDNLNEIDEPLNIFCKPSLDYLPDPQSCLITGITPQQCHEQGLAEPEFAQHIYRALSQSGTVGVGYNTIRFDDEVTRFLMWRNFIDPYAREWQNQCGRWDILDMMRTCYALRPDGLQWPQNEEGKISFKLEHLAAANGLMHEHAHDALSDVRATIALAKIVKEKQPKLFDFCFSLHKKEVVAEEMKLAQFNQPFIHISGMLGVERGCMSVMMPLAYHPQNKNEIICWDCAFNPTAFLHLHQAQNIAEIQTRLFSKQSDLPEGVARLPIKSIHINKSPIVIGHLKMLNAEVVNRWQMDMDAIQSHIRQLQSFKLPQDFSLIFEQVYQTRYEPLPAEQNLYGGFVNGNDKTLCTQISQAGLRISASVLATYQTQFQDTRLETLCFLYRARYFYDSLSEDEKSQWQTLCQSKLIDGAEQALTHSEFQKRLDAYYDQASQTNQATHLVILDALYAYGEYVMDHLHAK